MYAPRNGEWQLATIRLRHVTSQPNRPGGTNECLTPGVPKKTKNNWANKPHWPLFYLRFFALETKVVAHTEHDWTLNNQVCMCECRCHILNIFKGSWWYSASCPCRLHKPFQGCDTAVLLVCVSAIRCCAGPSCLFTSVSQLTSWLAVVIIELHYEIIPGLSVHRTVCQGLVQLKQPAPCGVC